MTTYSRLPLGLLFGLAFAALACTGIGTSHADAATPAPAAPAAPASPVTPASPASDDAMVACSVDADCVVVEMGCCDACNGGFMMSVATDQQGAAIARWHETECTNGCTEMACDWHEAPVCDAGVCARMEDRHSADGTVKRVLVHNDAPA